VTLDVPWGDMEGIYGGQMYTISRYAGESASAYLLERDVEGVVDQAQAKVDFLNSLACVMSALDKTLALVSGTPLGDLSAGLLSGQS
jgi:hypothetical protein